MHVRPETDADHGVIRELLIAGYGSEEIADMVDQLRRDPGDLISLVAETDAGIVGHVAFTPVVLDGHPELGLTGLACTAVSDAARGDGVGSELVHEGMVVSQHHGAAAVITLGFPGYYARFGFEPAEAYGLNCEYETPRDKFLIRLLEPDQLQGCAGTVRYPKAFTIHAAHGK